MTSERHHFDDLNTMIDEVHRLFETWAGGDPQFNGGRERLHRAKLAVHEWLANLVQHAQFPDEPSISLEVHRSTEILECVIEDNSEGFDLAGQLSVRQKIEDAFPERGMGLLMLHACAHDLTYVRGANGRQKLRFRVTDEGCKSVDIPF